MSCPFHRTYEQSSKTSAICLMISSSKPMSAWRQLRRSQARIAIPVRGTTAPDVVFSSCGILGSGTRKSSGKQVRREKKITTPLKQYNHHRTRTERRPEWNLHHQKLHAGSCNETLLLYNFFQNNYIYRKANYISWKNTVLVLSTT